ncbi:MAG: glycerophosphodiester phosphodiesterase [Balneolaceae bacterium]|nr:glycerophosphodiester phosphodiesterase [Balneolaceae bacterium]
MRWPHLKELAPDIPAALLYSSRQSSGMPPSQLLREYQADAFNCHYSQLTRKRLRDIRTNDIPVFVYTVNRKRRMRKLIKMGVRGIFSDKPDVLKQIVAELK